MKLIFRAILTNLLCISIFFSIYANATATASVDRNSLTMNETLQLNISLDERSMFGGPDLSALENDFEILGNQKSSQSSWINGKSSATTTWIYSIAPKRTGTLTIPPIDLDGQLTHPVSITVKPANSSLGTYGRTDPVFIEANPDKDSVFVQEQLLLTLHINSMVSLQEVQLSQLQIDNAIVEQISNTQYEREINNNRYLTYEVVFAIYPQASGDLTIPVVTAEGVIPDVGGFGSIFSRGKPVRLRTTPFTIHVKELPANIGTAQWLPAQKLALTETWSANPDTIKVGDSITRTITTTAIGLGGKQLPPISMEGNSHFKTYPDKPDINDTKTNAGITGIRKDTIAIIATQPGEITLPEISVQWWDIEANTLRTEKLPEVTLKVLGDASSATSATSSQSTSTTTTNTSADNASSITNTSIASASSATIDKSALLPWQIATFISSAIALLLFVVVIVLVKRKPGGKSDGSSNNTHDNAHTTKHHSSLNLDESAVLKNLRKACNQNDVAAIHSCLMAWAKQVWPDSRLHSMNDISRQFANAEFQQWVLKLDAHLYQNDQSSEQWLALYALVEEKEKSLSHQQKTKLAPLYPT